MIPNQAAGSQRVISLLKTTAKPPYHLIPLPSQRSDHIDSVDWLVKRYRSRSLSLSHHYEISHWELLWFVNWNATETKRTWPLIQFLLIQYCCDGTCYKKANQTMPLSARSPKAASPRLRSSSKKKTCQPGTSTKRQNRHSRTDEELNLLSYLRHLRRWRFSQIQ